MKIFIDTPEKVAEMAAQRYVELLKEKPNAILGGATGSTPLLLYAELARLNKAGEVSFAQAKSFNLDEYVGLDGDHDQSYRYFMDKNLFEHIDIDMANTRVPSGINTEIAAEYDKEIEAAGGVDMQLLGIGNNGHIGFNEPADEFPKETHCVDLQESTIQANKRFFEKVEDVPTQAYTMGINTIMQAKMILVIVSGADKAEIVKKAFFGPVTPQVPASILQMHPNVVVVVDEAAASLI